ncbi:hypothetical protein JOF56_005441 [Kibdelosporangium banguiense]|uniref:Uncharacterized protein n=1 Tax=Kibdelosporangium banguiense TaxID=1365924 RepID=A0ABS4TL01_9PSEU|nr:hypothetical protein [Kibdelosporangium banguiense]
MPSNLLVTGDRLAAVIDFATNPIISANARYVIQEIVTGH